MIKLPVQKLLSFGTLFSARIAGAVALFGVNLLIVRYLGLESLAAYAVFVSLVSILTVVISGGYTAIAPVFVAEYSKRKRPDLIKGFVRRAVKQGSLVLGVLCSISSLLVWLNFELPFVSDPAAVAAAIAAGGAAALLGFSSALLVGMKRQVAGQVPETFLRPTVFATLTGISLAAGYISQSLSIMWFYAVSAWLVFGYVWWRNRSTRQEYSEIDETHETKRWRRAAPSWMGISLLWDFMIDLMLLVTSILAGSIEIAILHVCFRYRVLAGFGMRTIHTLMMPEITEQTVVGKKKSVRRKLMQVNVASLAYSCLVMLGFTVLGPMLLELFSIQSAHALPVLLIVSATMLIRSIFGPAPLLLAIHNRHGTILAVSLITTILAFAFVFLTFSKFGILASAIGYTGANLLASMMLWYLAKIRTGFDCSIFANIRRIRFWKLMPKTA